MTNLRDDELMLGMSQTSGRVRMNIVRSDAVKNKNILEKEGGVYKVNAGNTRVELADESGDGTVKIIKGEDIVSWKYLGKKLENPSVEYSEKSEYESRVVYKDIEKGCDLEYVVTENRLKENIIVNEHADVYEYAFELDTGKLRARISDNNKSIVVTTANSDKVKYMIPAPVMTDADGKRSTDVYYTFKDNGSGKYTICVKADKTWINAEGRTLPVYIDPTIEYYADKDFNLLFVNGIDSQVYPTIGYDANGEKQTACIYTDLAGIKNIDDINMATITMKVRSLPNADFHWTPYSSYGETATYYTGDDPVSVTIDVTDVLKSSIQNGDNEFELVLQPIEDNVVSMANTSVSLMSMMSLERDSVVYSGTTAVLYDLCPDTDCPEVDCPELDGDTEDCPEVNCPEVGGDTEECPETDCPCGDNSDNVPTENYLIFDSEVILTVIHATRCDYINNQEIVSDTNDYINLYEGKLRYIEPIASSSGKEMPYALSFYYDPESKIWRNNFNQSVEFLSGIEAKYIDGNGERHTFAKRTINDTFADTEGLELTLSNYTDDNGSFTIISTLSGDKLKFTESGTLCEITNVYGCSINISFDLSGNMEIIDSNGHAMKVYYDSNNLPLKVVDEAGRTIAFENNTDKIGKITYPDGTSTEITYDTKDNIESIKARNGITSKYKYNSRDEVRFLNKFGVDNNTSTPNEYVEFEYRGEVSDDKTSYEMGEYKCRSAVLKTKTGINTVYVFDKHGRVTLKYEEKVVDGKTNRSEVTGTAVYAYTDKKRTFAATLSVDDDEHNLITNGSFEEEICENCECEKNCFIMNGKSTIVTDESTDGISALEISKDGGELTQTVTVNSDDLKYGNTLIASAWAKFDDFEKEVSLCAICKDSEGEIVETEPIKFNSSYNGWGYVAIPVVLDRAKLPAEVTVCITASLSDAPCYIDNIRLTNAISTSAYYKQYGDKYICDDGSEVTEQHFETIFGEEKSIDEIVTITDGIYTVKEYRDVYNNVLMSITEDLDGNIFKSVYSYDSYNKVIYSQDYKNIVTAYEYEGGLLKQSKTFYYNEFNPVNIEIICKNQTQALISSRTYTGEGEEYVNEEHDLRSDAIKLVNEYGRNCASILDNQSKIGTRGLVTKTTSPNGLETTYNYDDTDDKIIRIHAQNGSDEWGVFYGYDTYRRISRISNYNIVYRFTYDSMSRLNTITVADQLYSVNTYSSSKEGITVTTTYAEGDKLKVTTDRHHMPVEKTYTDTSRKSHIIATSEYDELGNVTKYIDKTTGKEYNYKYNELGKADNVFINGEQQKIFTYDTHGRLIESATHLEGGQILRYKPVYERNSENVIYPDNNIIGTNLENIFNSSVIKDNIDRSVYGTLYTYTGEKSFSRSLTYYDSDTRLSNYVAGLEHYLDGEIKNTYTYEYDNNGNITQVNKNGTIAARYTYDKMNQLIREDNSELGYTNTYYYDKGGNILFKQRYPYTTGTLASPVYVYQYGYESDNWDRLECINGQFCTYDSKGNPTKYRDRTLTWSRVRLLTGYGDNTFAYNADGIRIRKNSTTYELDGSNIIKESRNGNDIVYYYDNTGVCGFCYNGKNYFYLKSLQGDVTDIYDEYGIQYAEYVYDAWGNHTITVDVDGIGTLNPFRYRSYYYDTETKLYYLKSRYYDSELGRFINSDVLIDKRNILGFNLYTYCENNPVNMVDSDGYDPVPIWATNIINGTASELDYISAMSADPNAWEGSARYTVEKAIDIAYESSESVSVIAKDKPNFTPRKDKRHGSEKRQPSGERERNVAHPNGEEHSRVPKGNGIKRESSHEENSSLNITDTIIETAKTVGVGYVIYRIARLLPSFGLPFTLPVNLATP